MNQTAAIDTCLKAIREEWKATPPAKRAKWQHCIDVLLDARNTLPKPDAAADTVANPVGSVANQVGCVGDTTGLCRVSFPDMTRTMKRHLADHHNDLLECLEPKAADIICETMANAATMVLHGFCLAAMMEPEPDKKP